MKKNIFLALSLLSVSFLATATDCDTGCNQDCDTNCAQAINLWQPHAMSASSSNDIMHKRTFYTTESHRDEWQGMFSVMPSFSQSFGQKCDSCKSLGARPFWSGTATMTYGTNNGESNIDAYQFGMGDVIGQGSITLNPTVQSYGADMMLHFTKNKEERGMFFTIKAPLAAMSIETNVTENIASPDGKVDLAWLTYPAPGGRYQSLTEAWQAGTSTSEGDVSSSRHKLFVITKGRLSDCKQTAIRMADVTATAGYKLYASDKGFVDLGFKVSCPTGNVPQGEFILEPIVGRAGHWGVGGELTSRHELWDDGDKSVDFWMQGEIMHLFSGRKPDWRSFDLRANGKGSKYMLIQHYFPSNPSSTNPTGRLASFVTPAVNVTTIPVRSTFSLEGSVAVAFDMHKDNWNLMLGGEFWGRSKECLKISCCNLVRERVANLNDYAVLGRQISEDASDISNGNFVLDLHLCEPAATISKSQDRAPVVRTGGNPPLQLVLPLPEGVKDARLAENRIPANLNEALDIEGGAAARALTGKIFAQMGHTWKASKYTPNLSFFGAAEFVPSNNNQAVNLWTVGAQGSLNF